MYSFVVRVVEPVVEEHGAEGREPVADRGRDRDLADQVEPAGEPAPGRAAELRRPVVEAAGGRVGRGDLGHRERDDRAHEADEQPAPRDGDRAALLEGDVVRGQAAREDRDDREADREVLEPAHRAEELLRVAELVEDLLVLRGVDRTGAGAGVSLMPPPSLMTGPAVASEAVEPVAYSPLPARALSSVPPSIGERRDGCSVLPVRTE